MCRYGIVRRCIPKEKIQSILNHYHNLICGGHYGSHRLTSRVLESGFYWPTIFKDAKDFLQACNSCQCSGNISKKDEMPQIGILEIEIFDIWGIDFMGPFPSSEGNCYILGSVDYVSQWVLSICK